MNYKHKKAFTILELLVVIAIIAVISVIAIPSFIGKIEQANNARELAEISSVQIAAKMFFSDYGYYPTEQGEQPTLGNPMNIKFSDTGENKGLYPDYLMDLPHFSYWYIDHAGHVYHSNKKIEQMILDREYEGDLGVDETVTPFILKVVNGRTKKYHMPPVVPGYNKTKKHQEDTNTTLEIFKIKQISMGVNHTLALMEDGTVTAWGINDKGQLGLGNNTNKTSPTIISGLSSVKQVAAGMSVSFAVLEDGTVKAWGSNANGQLGMGSGIPVSQNILTPTIISGLTNVKEIYTNNFRNSVIALLNDGTVKAWGVTGDDEAGIYMGITPESDQNYQSTPFTIEGLTNVVKIFVGETQRAALLSNGYVKTWGIELLCSEWDRIPQSSTPIDADEMNYNSPVTDIAFGERYAVMLGKIDIYAPYPNSNLYTWGENSDQRSGYTNYTQMCPYPAPRIDNVRDVELSRTSTIITMNDGTLRVWGINPNGQLGNGTNTQVFEPTPLDGISGVTQVSMSPTSTIVLLDDGTIKSFGQNTEGQLGDGTTTNRLSPVVIKIYKD